ncbi:MAG: hypothetical protein ABIH03_00095 [Pseudomonadota bacterium]
MPEPDDLIGKADALMARHRLERPGSEPYAEIPVLREVVNLGARPDDLPVLTELAAPPGLDIEQVEALTESLRASLLTQLQLAFDQLIEARLKERLEPLFERMFNDLRVDLQLSAREMLSEVVNSTVEQELERRKSGG